MNWANASDTSGEKYICGYCGNTVGPSKGYASQTPAHIFICPFCYKPTYFDVDNKQTPGVAYGEEVQSLPINIENLYDEARNCMAASSYTAAVLICRKLLMNIAVSTGAPEGEPFIKYVDYLASEGYVPPNGRGWVDHIRKKGNEANHEIVVMSREDAEELITFSAMLLKIIFEFPSRISPSE